ncbi:MAG: hypothetical protein LJE68_02080 [Rhodobacter sp.]|nr:hypothetical protein [Rhodobacter sp.]
MTELSLVKTRIQAGIWEGVLSGGLGTGQPPEILVTHQEQAITAVAITADPANPGAWNVKIAIPPDLLSDGVQTFLIWDAETEEKLDSFTVVTGAPLEDDIRGELDLLRAELDMLKRAFRRHCVDTM